MLKVNKVFTWAHELLTISYIKEIIKLINNQFTNCCVLIVLCGISRKTQMECINDVLRMSIVFDLQVEVACNLPARSKN